MSKRTDAQITSLTAKLIAELSRAEDRRDKNSDTVAKLEDETDQLNERIRHLRRSVTELELLLPPTETDAETEPAIPVYADRYSYTRSRPDYRS